MVQPWLSSAKSSPTCHRWMTKCVKLMRFIICFHEELNCSNFSFVSKGIFTIYPQRVWGSFNVIDFWVHKTYWSCRSIEGKLYIWLGQTFTRSMNNPWINLLCKRLFFSDLMIFSLSSQQKVYRTAKCFIYNIFPVNVYSSFSCRRSVFAMITAL